MLADSFAPTNFASTLQIKDRFVYFSSLRNGEAENFFGRVISSPVTLMLNTSNPDPAAGPVTLEFGVQGVANTSGTPHQVDVSFNNNFIATITFFAEEYTIRTFPIPAAQILNGINQLKFTKTSSGEVCLVDYARLTYAHAFKANPASGNIHLVTEPNVNDTLLVGDRTYSFKASPANDLEIGIGANLTATAANIATRINADTAFTHCSALAVAGDVGLVNLAPGSSLPLTVDGVRLTKTSLPGDQLKFNLLGTQTIKVDGFTTPLVRLIDYTDPLNVGVSKPVVETSASGYAITAPPSEAAGKSQRLLYALPQGYFEQPAAITQNQPSTLNSSTNAGAYLIVAHKDLIASVEPLRAARASTMIAKTVDVEDIYDEFSFGVHGPQAIKSFLDYASTHWATPPNYVVFAGDASLDPRNYFNFGDFDQVPTKLIDTQFEETCSDDWLTDFHGDPGDNGPDGIPDIPVGRLPVRTPAEATALVNKIINFTPPPSPQSAILIADDPTNYYFNFESANDQVVGLLPPTMTVQKAYRRLAMKPITGTIHTSSGSTTVTGTGTLFTTEVAAGGVIAKDTGEIIGRVSFVTDPTILTLTTAATTTYNGAYSKQDDATATANMVAGFNQGRALANYSGHGNIDVWTNASIFTTNNALALTNDKLSFVVVMDCLNGYFQDPTVLSMSEAFLKATGGAVAVFASSGKTFPEGQHAMSTQLYSLIYGSQPIAMGDAIKISKGATTDQDVRRTWVFFGDPSMKIR